MDELGDELERMRPSVVAVQVLLVEGDEGEIGLELDRAGARHAVVGHVCDYVMTEVGDAVVTRSTSSSQSLARSMCRRFCPGAPAELAAVGGAWASRDSSLRSVP